MKNSSESPGRKNPNSSPDSAKMIAVTTGSAALPALSNHHSGLRKSGPSGEHQPTVASIFGAGVAGADVTWMPSVLRDE